MSLITRTDVTAVKLHSNYILAGIGSHLHVFNKESTKPLHKTRCLNGQKIYGFVPCEHGNKILVFGGKQLTIISGAADEFKRLFEAVVLDDWIHSAVWTDGVTVALLSAHNVVQKFDTACQRVVSEYRSADNSILYSGLLMLLSDGLVVFAGTVFSEVIVHCCQGTLHRLRGHRGVIFSVSSDPQKETIVTTSDDRSVRVWHTNNIHNHPHNTTTYWSDVQITCLHEVYCHTARVMRSIITRDSIISVGEDAAICFWDYHGKLQRKVVTHQNSSIWAVDCDEQNVVTGGGDCGVIMHPLALATEYGRKETLEIGIGTPKRILFTGRRNLVILNESNEMIYYNVTIQSRSVYELNHESTFKLLSISSCKQMVAVADMNCKLDIFAETCRDTAYLLNVLDTKLDIGKVMSMHWAGNRHLVFCSDTGEITVLAQSGQNVDICASFTLPPCKERWLTAAAMNTNSKCLVLGDRGGNIHIYVTGKTDPVKSFAKAHGRYGPTSITVRDRNIISTGRDGTIKNFTLDEDMTKFTFRNSKELEFNWVEKFLDKNERIVCGFQERVFVVYDVETNNKLVEVACGGGHRSWDAIRYFDKVNGEYEEFLQLVYIKNSDINSFSFQLSKIVSKSVVHGSHSKEINTLKTHKTDLDETTTFYISGGEDTTLRVSRVDGDSTFQDQVVSKHLSSVRTLKIVPLDNDRILIISAGGRAQICVKLVTFHKTDDQIKASVQDLISHMIKGTDKERKGNQTWRNCTIDFDPETRIMDLDCLKIGEGNFIIFTACSDACVRVFNLTIDPSHATIRPVKEFDHHKTCILKTKCMKIANKDVLVLCTSRGEVSFWEVCTLADQEAKITVDIKALLTVHTNKSGINGLDTRLLSDDRVVIATAGDDNAIHLNVFEVPNCDLGSIRVTHKWQADELHSSQITGVILLDDLVVSTSIDQRVTVCSWRVNEEGIDCQFMSQVFSDIADIHGMELMEYSGNSLTVCVYGKGIEVLTIPVKRS